MASLTVPISSMSFTTPTAFIFAQAFLKLDAATKLWIQTKAQMYVSLGRFGATEINLFKQQIITRYGATATTGSPSLVEIAIWYVLNKVTAPSFQLGGMTLQTSPQQQQQLLQTLSNVSRLLHDTAQTTISNLR